jgi:hypothetical protein
MARHIVGREPSVVKPDLGSCAIFSRFADPKENPLSPILVRPIREQLEHDRVIRLLQAKYKRKCDVSINPGNERTAPVVIGASDWYPDLVVQSSDPRPKLLTTVEVETAESVNHLEALSQWATFARLRVPFHLYVPVSSVDPARRLCASLKISVSEIWAYNALGDQILFTLVTRLRSPETRHGRASKAQNPARHTASKRTAPARTETGRAEPRKPAGKKPVVRAAAPRKVAKVVKKATSVVKKVVKKVVKRVPKSVAKKVSKPARSAKTVKAARPARTAAKKASNSSRPKKR